MNNKYYLVFGVMTYLTPYHLIAATPQQGVEIDLITTSNEESNEASKSSDGSYINVMDMLSVQGSYTADQQIDTATGLGLTLRETPQSVSVITEQQIQDQNMNTVKDAVLSSVGLSATTYDNVRNDFSARGFTITNYQIDGVPVAWSLAGTNGETILDLATYERVEVVRGATGLMTGSGNPSASINLVRKHADSTDLKGYVDVGVGSWNQREVTADISDGLNSDGTIRGRIVVKHKEGDSYTDLYQDDNSVLYGVLEADITPETMLRLGAGYQHNDPVSPTWGLLPAFFSNGNQTDWGRSKTTAPNWSEWETKATTFFTNLTHDFNNGWQLKANYNYLKYESARKLLYLMSSLDESDGSGLTGWTYKSAGDSVQNSIDIQLSGDYEWLGKEHDLMLGALRNEQTADSKYDKVALNSLSVANYYTWDGSFEEPNWGDKVAENDVKTTQTGYFAATRLHVSDDLKVILGGRLSDWKRKGLYESKNVDYGDNSVFIPYSGILYDLTPSQRVYASYTEIFQPQNYQDINGDSLDPLTGKSYEAGLKSAYLNDALQTSFAVYRIEQDNLGQDTGYTIPGSINKAYIAAKGTVSKGFEAEVTGQVTKGLKLGTGYSQFRAVDANNDEVNTDLPTKQFKLFGTYNFAHNLPELTIGAGVNWQNKTYAVNTTNGNTLTQDSFALFNAMTRYDINQHMHIQFNINNITDEKYLDRVGTTEYRYGAPRNFMLSFKYTL